MHGYFWCATNSSTPLINTLAEVENECRQARDDKEEPNYCDGQLSEKGREPFVTREMRLRIFWPNGEFNLRAYIDIWLSVPAN